MSGILDNKTRVLDTILTLEGRSQLSQGGIDVAYLSFTDAATFYRADVASGSQDATLRIYLESCQLPQDQITFQADDSGNVLPFSNADGIPQSPGKILAYTYTGVSSSVVGATVQPTQTVSASTGAAFAANADALLASSGQNFNKLRVLSTFDTVFEEAGFGAGPNQITFTINNTSPIKNTAQFSTQISALDSIFSDPRFSGSPNFKYLPPINKVSDMTLDLSDHRATSQLQIGNYVPWGRTQAFGLSYAQIMYELQYYQQLGCMRTVNFDPTSLQNNLVGQFFEKQYNTLVKLDVVDFGIHRTGNPAQPTAHVFFVGKVLLDEKGSDTFIHLFTLVFR